MERFPISVRLIGVMHKDKSKMFMTSVLWSDQNEILVHRTFEDFKEMHKQLKKTFPTESKADRILPKFQDKRMKAKGSKKGPTKSLLRIKFLQKYCNALLSCDPRVSQSAGLVQFFHPKDQELQADFSKNSIIIMPSEDELKTAGQSNGGNVTQPFVTETYRCVAAYETKDTKNKPFKVAEDEKVDVLIKDKAGWWLVENDDKRMAWFPAPYLEKADDDDDDYDEADGTTERGVFYNAIKNYKATKKDEISVTIGAVVEVLQRSENGWWLIRYKGKAGYIPAMYLQPFNNPHIRMAANHHDHPPSAALQLPSQNTIGQQSRQLSHSQGNLPLLLPPVSPSLSHRLQPDSKQKSRSMNILSEPPAQQVASYNPAAVSNVGAKPFTAQPAPPPMIMVEMDEADGRRRSLTGSSDGSFMSDSDFSIASSASSSLNLSLGANDERLRLSRTPPPTTSHQLSPTSGQMTPSVSDPNLYKSSSAPKVPPRPQNQEILTRCTTITRKNLGRRSPSPSPAEIQSR